ncbi:MAG: M66 family metalloprotease [Myxococcales bacterium]|nr:M66 family metalloprotease [Myxococcales bacterium]MDH3482963.1 M66 family metalloprotease [Myxococcales bacterium]
MRSPAVLTLALGAFVVLGCTGVIGSEHGAEPPNLAAPTPPSFGVDGGLPIEPGIDGGQAPMTDAGQPPPPDCNPATAPPMAVRSLRISDVTINQGVSVPVVDNAAPVNNRVAPVIADRDGVMRVFVEPQADWQTRDVIARLTLNGSPRETQIQVTGASSATTLASTINFGLGPGELAVSSTFSVELLEVDPCGTYAGTVSGSRYPATSTQSLNAVAAPGPFRIVLVPVRYQADGSNRTPNTDGVTVARFTQRMYGMFPLADFEVSVRQSPLDFDRAISADGGGWTDLLNECLSIRAADNASPNTYYYCAVRPSDNLGDFCGGGCVAGIGPVPSAGDTFNRGALGLLYSDDLDTFVHEIGHSLGLPHAPCGVPGDPAFPYSNGGIGVLGFDRGAQALISTQYRDVMGYCDPVWISDYNYDKLYDRLVSVTAQSVAVLKSVGSPLAFRPVLIDIDGTLTIGETLWADDAPLGEPVTIEWVDEAGHSEEVVAILVRVTHVPGGIIYVPEMPNPPATIRVPGYGTTRPRQLDGP